MKKRFVAFLLVLIMVLGMLPVSAMAASNSTVVLHPSVNRTVTGVKVKVGDTISGHTVSTISGYDITVDLGKYNVNNDTFRLPYAKDIWEGVDNNKVDYISWAGGGSNKRSEGGSALLVNGKNTAYYYSKGATPTKYTYHLIHEFNYVGGTRWDITATTAAESYQIDVNKGKPTRDRYKFDGWADTANATTARYFGGELITLTKDNPTKTIYAVWKPIFELHYNANGGTGAPDSQTYTALSATSTQATFTVPNQTPTKDGYTFKGWADSSTATTAQYQPGGTIAVKHTDSPKTVYAVWEESAPQPPLIPVPSYDDLKSAIGKIQVKDVSTPGCGTENYDLIDNTQSEPFNWTKTARLDQPGKYDVTIKTAPYVAKYNSEKTKTHELNNANQTTLRLVISYENSKWVLDDGLRVIEVKHSEQTPPTDKPDKPTALDGSFAIVCKNNEATHAHKADYIATPSQYTISDVQTDEQGYYVTATVTVAPNLVAYNTLTGAEHRLVNEQDATLTITFRYDTEVTVDENRKWTQQGEVPVVEVICKPKAPTADDLKKLEMAVQVKCVVDDSQQHTEAYGLLGEYDEDYFVGEPRKDGDDWLCDINYYPERYVAAFNTTFQNLKHVQNDEKIVPVTLIWAGDSWQLKTQGRVHVTEEYTVTYTDGVDGEEVFADQVYSDLRKDSTTPAFNGTPTRTGYTFAGWEPEVAETVTQTVIYVAMWTPVEPKAPTADELKELDMAVQVKCVVDDSQQHTEAYGLLGEYDEDYFVGEPRKDGDDWLCDINYYPERYVAAFNTTFQNLKHVQNDEKIVPVTLIWAGDSWQLKTQGRVHVTEEYTVTYTDGVDGEEVFADQVYSDLRKDSTTPAFNGTPTRTGYTFAGWEPEVAETVTETVTYAAKWHVTPHNIYAYARLNSYFAPLTTNEFDTPVTLNEATLSRLGLGSYNSLGYISIGSFTFDAMPLTDDQYFGDDAELSAVAEKLATDIALETGVSDKIAEKIAWTVLYKTVNEEDMAPGYPAEAGYQLSGNLDLATVMFKANGENVTGMPEDNYVYNDVVGLYDFYFTGDTITLPADPTREGYIFEGWSVKVLPAENDADHLDADGADDAADETLLKAGDTYTITAGGVIFTAQWEARTDTPYTVEHYLENLDGSYALDTTEPLKGTTDTTVTAAAKSYDNFTYDSTVPGTVASGNIAGDGSLVLKLFYTRNTYDYTVRHIKQLPDGSYDEANAEVETLSGKFEALAAVTAKDYGSHYPTNDAGTKQNIKIEKNLTIDVKYDLDNHTLTFETNGGSTIAPVTVRHGNAVARPADPTKDKYTFIGWYVDPEFSAEYDFATVLEADKTIYAKFELTSTPIGDIYVRYDVLHIKQLPDGSYDLANAEVEHLSAKKDTTVTAVVKDYSATHHINVNSTLSKLTDTAIQPYPGADGKPVYTILSVYYDLDFHTLTFDTMGGSRIDPVTVRHGNAVAKPKDPVNGGYIFDGWYTDKTYRTPYNFATVLTQDTTIYAKWFLIALPGVTIKKTTPKLNTSDHFAYVQGYPDGTVKPTGNITRAETAAILFRLMDEGSRKTYYSTKSGFRDVATGSWYNTYVATLNNAGVITDSSNGYFRPNEAITRAELAAMLANFTETAGAANYFNDVSARYWAANAIAICAKLGWITGYPDGSFRPDRNVTRAELMAMINRATGRAPKSADAFLPGMKTWSDNTADKWYYLDVQEATNSHSYTVKDSEKWTALNADPNWSLYE